MKKYTVLMVAYGLEDSLLLRHLLSPNWSANAKQYWLTPSSPFVEMYKPKLNSKCKELNIAKVLENILLTDTI